MMRGTTLRRQATLPVTLRLPGQPDFALDFVVDTGFSEFLTLPVAAVAAMGLPLLFRRSVSLADGSVITVAIHSVAVIWNDIQEQVNVLATGRRPLIGTMLLDEQELRVRFHEGDLVSVEDL